LHQLVVVSDIKCLGVWHTSVSNTRMTRVRQVSQEKLFFLCFDTLLHPLDTSQELLWV